MPKLPPRPCTSPACKRYASNGGRCREHQPIPWDHKGKSAKDRGYGAKWARLRNRILARDGFMCLPCLRDGVYTAAKEVDHIVPKAEGGTDSATNLQSICKQCHTIKTQKEARRAKNG